MEISRDGAHWGQMQVNQENNQVHFHASGELPKYGEILRVWGMRDGAQPLLIGVAEPAGEGLQVERTLTKQYLESLGYWPELPKSYVAGICPPAFEQRPDFHDRFIKQLLHNDAVTLNREAGMSVFTCKFAPECEFPFAFIFSCCTVKNACAKLIWDEKKDCPVWTVPE
ncbi:MAG: hypothetical protein LUE11_00070 [Clostridia bacterium]|nr:hypothetical protein [Clostridia bacterium]